MKVINLFAGPGSGKSTLAAGLFHVMKRKGFNVELVTEYAKAKVWEESTKTLDDQVYVFAKQLHRQRILQGKVDYTITDSPVLLSLIYGAPHRQCFADLVTETFNDFDNINVFVERTKDYVGTGRLQTEPEACAIDFLIMGMLKGLLIPHIFFDQYRHDDCAARLYEQLKNHFIE